MTALAHAVPAQIQFHQAHLARQRRMKVAVRKAMKPKEREWTQHHDAHVIARSHLILSLYQTVNVKSVKHTAHGLMRAFFAVCPYSKNKLFSRRRFKEMVYWRQALMHLLYCELDVSLPMIGRMMNGRDHTTILHAVKVVNAAIEAGNVEERKLVTGHTIYIRRKAG